MIDKLTTRMRGTASGAALTAALAACGGEAGGDGARSTSLDAPDYGITPAVEEAWSVGALDGEAWEVLGDIVSMDFDSDGNLYALDSQAGHVLVFDVAGNYLRTIGRSGEGPGEIGDGASVRVLPDNRLAVYDRGRFAVQLFTLDGEYLELVAYDPADAAPYAVDDWTPGGAILTTGVVTMNTEGSVDAEGQESRSVSMSMGGPSADGRPVYRFGLDGTNETVHIAAALPPVDEDPVDETGEGVQISMNVPRAFTPPLLVAALSDGRVAVADSIAYLIRLVADGTQAGVLARPVEPMEVNESIRSAHREQLMQRPTMTRLGMGGDVPPEAEAMIEQAYRRSLDRIQFGDFVPVVRAMAADLEDRLWVERAAMPGEPGPVDILTPDGRYLGTIPPGALAVPDAFGPDGLMAYEEESAIGYPVIRVVRMPAAGLLESAAGATR
ncbi:MAG: 6-bladed beta-propeller [Gemmatimonadetes bacterium]|nr:6-bladed beta-propeller [Gemmatimonadota bacterium]